MSDPAAPSAGFGPTHAGALGQVPEVLTLSTPASAAEDMNEKPRVKGPAPATAPAWIVGAGSAAPFGRWGRLTGRLMGLFATLFCLHAILAALAFPLYKHRLAGYVPVAVGFLLGVSLCLPTFRLRLNTWLAGCSRGTFLFLVIALAAGLRLLACWLLPLEPVNDHLYYHRYAVNLLEGKGYGNIPWPHLPHLNAEGGPKAFYPPGMSLLLAGWYAVVGATPLAGKALNVLLGTILVPLLYDIARRAGGELVGRWAAALVAVLPTLVLYSASLGYEMLLAVVLALVVKVAVAAAKRTRWHHLVILGLLLGAGSLVKPVCLLIPGILLIWWLAQRAGWRALPYTALTCACMAVVIAPWTLRNHLVFGQFVLISTNGGYVLYSANNPTSHGIHEAVPPLPGETDEVAMNTVRAQAARKWILANPGQCVRLAMIKTTITWGTASTIMSFLSCDRMSADQERISMALLNTAWVALLVVCLHTTWTTNWCRQLPLLVPLLLLAYFFGLHLIFEAETRHHIPVLSFLILVASGGLARLSRDEVSTALPA